MAARAVCEAPGELVGLRTYRPGARPCSEDRPRRCLRLRGVGLGARSGRPGGELLGSTELPPGGVGGGAPTNRSAKRRGAPVGPPAATPAGVSRETAGRGVPLGPPSPADGRAGRSHTTGGRRALWSPDGDSRYPGSGRPLGPLPTPAHRPTRQRRRRAEQDQRSHAEATAPLTGATPPGTQPPPSGPPWGAKEAPFRGLRPATTGRTESWPTGQGSRTAWVGETPTAPVTPVGATSTASPANRDRPRRRARRGGSWPLPGAHAGGLAPLTVAIAPRRPRPQGAAYRSGPRIARHHHRGDGRARRPAQRGQPGKRGALHPVLPRADRSTTARYPERTPHSREAAARGRTRHSARLGARDGRLLRDRSGATVG